MALPEARDEPAEATAGVSGPPTSSQGAPAQVIKEEPVTPPFGGQPPGWYEALSPGERAEIDAIQRVLEEEMSDSEEEDDDEVQVISPPVKKARQG